MKDFNRAASWSSLLNLIGWNDFLIVLNRMLFRQIDGVANANSDILNY